MTEEWIIRAVLVFSLVFFCFYQFGYSDKFPYIGKNQWRKRKHYPETFAVLMQQVSKHTNGAPLTDASLERLHSTADMILKALHSDYDPVEVNLPNFDCGAVYKDLHIVVYLNQVLDMHVEDHQS
ncbi:MAG TPA: hypothetical protein DHW71_11410 [Gammaproteobacteria bacterium]|mgnify:FL=1|nr:hypothetical protein [Gammaproteobacteria bacterium]MEC8009377.1 hypothetical protein [Pseudomonadota bacterium]HBF09978.1 hypothetical protein [Gammaproteobacteria bacterium]HCK93591.1 hypothetical protein [Gammaproteobacteria bacterium]|tara:strand:- start:1759 stop:2133 length:375 start_codon:yes stop_codon:yes gene_type:complete